LDFGVFAWQSACCSAFVRPAGNVPVVPSRYFVPFDVADTEQSIPARFEHMARRWAHRLAVKSGDASWSYQELRVAATRVACEVIDRIGTRPQPVAVMVGQGPQLMAAILGVLKAGHFYVPLDPTQPRDACRAIFDDCGTRLVVSDATHRPAAQGLEPRAGVIDVARCGYVPHCPTFPQTSPDALACLYYTSGSTGPCKGVMDTHRNVLHNVLRYTNALRISVEDRLSLVQSPVFSGVMSSQFGALLNGAAIFPYDMPSDGIAGIARWLREERITIYHSVPSIFRHMLRVVDNGQTFPEIRVVRLEGDGATQTDAVLFRQHFTDRAVLSHGLGATECGLVRRLVISRDSSTEPGHLPVGYPVDDVTVRIVADDGCEAASGECGEITIESRYLSPGYWGRPDLTAAAFSPGREPGTRQYRTGDMGRLSSDGCLEHLGRTDGQAKVRGQRVRIEAAEAAIMATGLVHETAIAVRSAPSGERRLVAYVVPVESELRVSDLRKRLADVLPAHEVPSRFVVLDRLPVTAHYKIDREALPAPTANRPLLDVPFIAPRTGMESVIAAAWATTLDLDFVGIRDNFFDLGGDSLDAVAMLANVTATIGTAAEAISVFECPTVEAFAGAIEDRVSGRYGGVARPDRSPLVRVRPAGSRAPFFFLHAEYGGDGFYCLNVARHLPADQPFFGLSPLGRDGGPLPCSIEEMAASYLSIVRREQPKGPYSIGGFCSGGIVAWEMAQQLRARGEEVALLVLIEPPAVETGTVARAVHGVTELSRRLGVNPEARVVMRQRAMRIARLRALPPTAATFRRLPALVRTSLQTTIPDGGATRRIAATYSRAVDAYLARPYDGPVLCLQANEEAGAIALGEWRRLAPNLTARHVPGNHNTCIVKHAGALASALAASLAPA
jgi:amino acid adenylation domain-containing protein